MSMKFSFISMHSLPFPSSMSTQELGFKCRRCRFYLFGGGSLVTGTSDDGSLQTSSFVWYLNEEVHPNWIQEAINEAQWTKGKLNCPKCHGRLGSFDFITPNKAQMSESVFSPIQIIKNRVDCESSNPIIDKVQKINREAISIKEEPTTLNMAGPAGKIATPHVPGDQPNSVISSYADATAAILPDNERNNESQSSHFAEDLYDNDSAIFSDRTNETGKDLCSDESVHQADVKMCITETAPDTTVRRRPTSQSASVVQSDPDLTNNQSRTEQAIVSTHENIERSSEQTIADGNENVERARIVQEEISEMGNSSQHDNDGTVMGSSTGNDQFIGTSFDGENSESWEDFFDEIIDEIEESRMLSSQTGMTYQEDDGLDLSREHDISPSRLHARERAALRRDRNRRKKERRKQRRKEKWIESHNGCLEEQDTANFSGLVDILGTDWSRQALQEVTTCSICLDVFYQPHSCVPCNHIFCEPCLRQLASVHHVVAPCPLCRTSIQTVVQHYELTTAIKKLFPTQVQRRREAERRTLHRSYPLPGHSSLSSITRPWFSIPRFRTSDTNERVRQFTSRVNHVRQRRQELNRTFIHEIAGETLATLMFFAVVVGVIIAFLSLMQEFA